MALICIASSSNLPKLSEVLRVLDWTFAITVLIDDFTDFLPPLLFLGIVTYLYYRLSYELSSIFLKILFGRIRLTRKVRLKHYFATCILTSFIVMVLGAPSELIGAASVPFYNFDLAFICWLLLGGSVFIFSFTKEMLKQSNLHRHTGAIPAFWRTIDKHWPTDFKDYWKTVEAMPPSMFKKFAIFAYTAPPAFAIILLSMVFAFILEAALLFSLLLDVIVIGWISIVFLRKFKIVPKMRFKFDTLETLGESLLQSYHPIGSKTVFVLLNELSNLMAVTICAQSFYILFLSLPSFLFDTRTLGATLSLLLLFTPMISYQLYFWHLLVKRGAVFLRAWGGKGRNIPKTQKLELWALVLFTFAWYPLIIEDFLLGHHFYPTIEGLSLSFLFDLDFNGVVAMVFVAIQSIVYTGGLLRLVRTKTPTLENISIFRDNVIYGLINLGLWSSVTLILELTQVASPWMGFFMLYVVFTSFYLPDLSGLIERKFKKHPWIQSIGYWGPPFAFLCSYYAWGMMLMNVDRVFTYAILIGLTILACFAVWTKAKFAR